MKVMTKIGCPVRVSALFFLFFSALSGHAGSAVTQRPLHIWFNTPCTLKGKAVWKHEQGIPFSSSFSSDFKLKKLLKQA